MLRRLVTHPGNSSLVRAAQLSLLAVLNGHGLHIHAEGVRGTGKTSVLRAYKNSLPHIERIRECPYNCDPSAPHCPYHRGMNEDEVRAVGTEQIPLPFLEISPSARLGSVVGSLDLEKLTAVSSPLAAVLPGTIPRAHRGIIFVDEINRLADTAPELADVLLDVMGTRPGRIQIEESGLPKVELPVMVSVWAASNPDEEPGPLEEIRRQLSDRFDFVVPVRRPSRRDMVEQILELANDTDWEIGCEVQQPEPAVNSVSTGALSRVEFPLRLRSLVAGVYVEFQLESLRAAQALQLGARLNALLDNRSVTTVDDLTFVAPLALEHRVDPQLIPRILKYLEVWRQEHDEPRQERRTDTSSERQAPATLSGSADQQTVSTAASRDQSRPQTGSSEESATWLHKAMRRLSRTTGAGCGEGKGGDGNRQTNCGKTSADPADPTRTPVLAPPRRARRLVELEERALITEPMDGDQL